MKKTIKEVGSKCTSSNNNRALELCRAAVATCAQCKEVWALLVEALDSAIDAGGADEKHPLARRVDYPGDLVTEYKAKDKMPSPVTGADALRYLMQRDGLRQADLPELGSQGVVSGLLFGRHDFNAHQAKALAERFGVSAVVFVIPKTMAGNLIMSKHLD